MAATLVAALALVAEPMTASAAQTASPAAIRVAVIDSGIEADHPEFKPGQVVAWRDFVDNAGSPYDDHGHGTAVASRVAGATLGSHPGASLIVAKVLNSANTGQWGVTAKAIEWAADQGARVITVSIWQQIPNPSTHARQLARAIDYATSKGALVVWIAGNGGAVATPSTFLPGAASPAVLVVGAATDSGAPASFSQLDPEVLATGASVPIAWTNGSYAAGSGTSFAAPRVAGIVARMIGEGAPADPGWLKWVLLHSATDTARTYVHEGYGFLDAAAVSRAVAVSNGTRPMPKADSRDGFHLASTGARTAQSATVPVGALPPR